MTYEKDYLMRQLMMLFEVIQKILRYRKKGEKGKALDQIDYFYSCLKIDNKVDELQIEPFIRYLEKENKLTNEQLELVGFVLKEQGELAENKKKKSHYFQKAWFILNKVDRESTSFSMDRQMKLAELKARLN